jgi:signal transduction histidine kinase
MSADLTTPGTYTELAELSRVFQHMQIVIAQRDHELEVRSRQLAETNERLRKVNRNYMETLGFVTHELKAPLVAIHGMSTTLATGAAGNVPPDAARLLERIRRNCEELQDMVKNYLDLSRVERGELEAHKSAVEFVREVIEPVVGQTSALFESRAVRLNVSCPAELNVTADPELMRIALTNYLTNAAKYGKEGGEARLEAVEEGGEVTVAVWNEGPGFSREQGANLFRKFVRIRDENTRNKRGSGLGLFLCRQILDLHGGRVWAESEPGEWARFAFRFPARVTRPGPSGPPG